MSGASQIEWTQMTWNPVTGCTKVSAGCKHCYAETLSHRLQAIGVNGYERGFELTLHPARLDAPLRRKRPTVWFVNSMSDLFHEKVPFAFVDGVMETIRQTPQHIYQILTKRPQRMARYFTKRKVPENAWLGVSVENQRHGVPRIDVLRSIQADIRFLSCEPLLEDLGTLDLHKIHWVIVGGESGGKARPMRKEWAESIRQHCAAEGVAFFFKQWGAFGEDGVRRSKKANGRRLNRREWNTLPKACDIRVHV